MPRNEAIRRGSVGGVSANAILAAGNREAWKGVEVTFNGEPDNLGITLLRLLRAHGGTRAVADAFVSEPWGWTDLRLRDRRTEGRAAWIASGDELAKSAFGFWFVLDVERDRLEVFDVAADAWLEPAELAKDGLLLNHPGWIGDAPLWLQARRGVVTKAGMRIQAALRDRDVPMSLAHRIVAAWLQSLVPGDRADEWHVSCHDEATSWSAYRIAKRLLWIPDRLPELPGDFILATSHARSAVAFDLVAPWRAASLEAGVPPDEVTRVVQALFIAAASGQTSNPVDVSIEGEEPPEGLGDRVKRWFTGPKVVHLPRPKFIVKLGALDIPTMERMAKAGEIPFGVVEEPDGTIREIRAFEPPQGWLVELVRAVSDPAGSADDLPEWRRARFWLPDDAEALPSS